MPDMHTPLPQVRAKLRDAEVFQIHESTRTKIARHSHLMRRAGQSPEAMIIPSRFAVWATRQKKAKKSPVRLGRVGILLTPGPCAPSSLLALAATHLHQAPPHVMTSPFTAEFGRSGGGDMLRWLAQAEVMPSPATQLQPAGGWKPATGARKTSSAMEWQRGKGPRCVGCALHHQGLKLILCTGQPRRGRMLCWLLRGKTGKGWKR